LIRLTSLTRFAMVILFVVVQVLGLEMQAEREKFAAGQGEEDAEKVGKKLLVFWKNFHFWQWVIECSVVLILTSLT